MKQYAALAFVLGLLARPAFAVVADDYLDKDAPEGTCKIEFYGTDSNKASETCTGSLIARDRVLTASHCANILSADSSKTAKVFCSGPFSTRDVVGMSRNPKFVNINGYLLHDTSIFELDSGYDEVKPVTFAETQDQVTALLAAGNCELWGYGADSVGRVGMAHGAVFQLQSQAQLQPQIGSDFPAQMLFTGPSHADHGDSGGPTFCPDSKGGFIQIAVTSQRRDSEPLSMHDPTWMDSAWIHATLSLPHLPSLR